ncbi:hypothetical protein BC941DRAFT_454475 [Chlamydoabsidia padenii]|nr:hypothetical protein BC941DRAFT_454475 [Chlamydoabsidia padenii]
MSLSPLSNFTVLIKKIARKSTLRRTKKQRSKAYRHTTTTTTITQDQDLDSVSSCSISIANDTMDHTTQDDDIETTSSDIVSVANDTIQDDANETTNNTILIRDFAYPDTSPLHHGTPCNNDSHISLSSSRFNGCQAKVLYDFVPETDHEIAMKAGQIIWIQYRQCTGWLIADVDDDTGLVPESYIELL